MINPASHLPDTNILLQLQMHGPLVRFLFQGQAWRQVHRKYNFLHTSRTFQDLFLLQGLMQSQKKAYSLSRVYLDCQSSFPQTIPALYPSGRAGHWHHLTDDHLLINGTAQCVTNNFCCFFHICIGLDLHFGKHFRFRNIWRNHRCKR